MSEPTVKLLLIATHQHSAMLDTFSVITALVKQPENNFQFTVGRWKFNSQQHKEHDYFSNSMEQFFSLINYGAIGQSFDLMKKIYGCNFKEKSNCALPHKFLTPEILYETSVTNNNDDVEKIYHGLCKTAFNETKGTAINSFKNLNRSKIFLLHLDIKERQNASSIKWKLYLLFAVNP